MQARSIALVALTLAVMSTTSLAEDETASALVKAATKSKVIALHAKDAVATLQVAHGKTVVVYSGVEADAAFNIVVAGGESYSLARPGKRADEPFAVALASTPKGFTAFFQDVETANANEAHTYLVELDKTGKPTSELREVAIPWSLGDAVWNGSGFHLALYYAGGGDGVRLSMVTCSEQGQPREHPDWASRAGLVSDVHLVATGAKIRAFYKGSMGDRLHEVDVTKIRNWGTEPPRAKDLGAIAASQGVAISATGGATRVKR